MVLPHFTTTGPPNFIANSSGMIAGLHLETNRGEVLKGIIEGIAFYLKEVVDSLPMKLVSKPRITAQLAVAANPMSGYRPAPIFLDSLSPVR